MVGITAVRRAAFRRLSSGVTSLAFGSSAPTIDTAVRSTAMGWADDGAAATIRITASGTRLRSASSARKAASSSADGGRSCQSRNAISS